MAETYCGKSCGECPQKEELDCPGCRTGPGREFGGDCELARCVREKGHETCGTCLNQSRCGTWQGRNHMTDSRRRKQEAQEARDRLLAQRAPVLGKWLWLLFWLIVPNTISGLLNQEFVTNALPWLRIPGSLLNTGCLLAYGLILMQLGSLEEGYRTAGICSLTAAAVNLLIPFFTGSGETPPWTLILTLPAAAIGLYGEYREFMAHSAVLTGVDSSLAENWEKLWKWYIGVFAALFGGLLVTFMIPILGLLVVLGSAIGMIVVSILKLVYLYRTAKLFREYPAPV